MEEPMDIDTIDSDFDKENQFQHNNVLPKTPCTEKGYEELDVSELNMKLRYSLTPVSSPMSKSYTVNCSDKKLERGDNSNLTQIDPSKMTQSLNSTVNLCDSLKISKVLHLKESSSEPLSEINTSVSILRSLDSLPIIDNIPVIVNTVQDEDNLSLPSTSSLPHTPDATTPVNEMQKDDGGSPIMRGLKSVLSMFRPSQSPVMTAEEKPQVNSTTSSDADMQKLLMSTPISGQTHSANKNPYKESITFVDDLEKELQWKDETTVSASQEKTLVQKNFSQIKLTNEMDNKKDMLNKSVEYMDISCNDTVNDDNSVTNRLSKKLQNRAETTLGDSDNEFVDCETTFTKDESLYVDANINSDTGISNENSDKMATNMILNKNSALEEINSGDEKNIEQNQINAIPKVIPNDIHMESIIQDVGENEIISSQENHDTTLTKILERSEKSFEAVLEHQSNENQNNHITDKLESVRGDIENKEVTNDIKENHCNDTINLSTMNCNDMNQTLTDQNSTIDIITSIENITNENEDSKTTLKDQYLINNSGFETNLNSTISCSIKSLPSDIPLPQENEFNLEDTISVTNEIMQLDSFVKEEVQNTQEIFEPIETNEKPVNVDTCLCEDEDSKLLPKDRSPHRENNCLLTTVKSINNEPTITEITRGNNETFDKNPNINLSQLVVNEVCLVLQNESLLTSVTESTIHPISDTKHEDQYKMISDKDPNLSISQSTMEIKESNMSFVDNLITQKEDVKSQFSTVTEVFDRLNTTVEFAENDEFSEKDTMKETLSLAEFVDHGDSINSKPKSKEEIQQVCTEIVRDSETSDNRFSTDPSPAFIENKNPLTELECEHISTADYSTTLDGKILSHEISKKTHTKDTNSEEGKSVPNVRIVPDFLIEANEEEILLSENNSPYVSLTVNEPEVKQINEVLESVNQMTQTFDTQKSPPSSPRIVSKGNYNFNLDEIDDPFATKTKIRLSPPPNTEKLTFEINEESKTEPTSCKERQFKLLNKDNQKKKSGINLKQNNKAVHKKITQQETRYSENEDCKLNDIASVISKPDVIKDADGGTILYSDTEIEIDAIAKIQNSAKLDEEVPSSEQSTYYSAPSSTDSVNSKNDFNIPEIAHSETNLFASVSKMRHSPGPDQCLNVNNVEIKNALSDDELNCSTSSKVTDDKNVTVREINTEDEDTIEGPFLGVEELNDIDIKQDLEVNKVDMIQFSDMNQESEDNAEGEMFIDAEAFEFLLNQNNANMVADSGKESLFLKFDPLFAKRVSAEGVLASVCEARKKQSTPKKKEKHLKLESTLMDISAVPGTSNVMDMSYEFTKNATFEDRYDESMNSTVTKPTMAVTPAVNSAVSPRNKTFSPTRSNRRSYTFTSPAIAVIDRLLSMSGNNSILGQDTTVVISNEQHEAELALTQLREILAEKEINVHQLKCETNELRYRLETFELQIKKLEEESQERLKNIDSLNAKLAEKTRDNKNMAVVVEEYERTIASLIAEKEQEKRRREEERMQLIRERDEQIAHLANMECSFNDLHSKYEKSKGIIISYKANEDTYKKTLKDCQEKVNKMHDNYELLKQHATSKLNHANQELEKINRAHESEVLKLHTMIKRREVEITSLEESLAQKTKANDELAAICDELINKVG